MAGCNRQSALNNNIAAMGGPEGRKDISRWCQPPVIAWESSAPRRVAGRWNRERQMPSTDPPGRGADGRGYRWLSPPANVFEPSGLKGNQATTTFLKMIYPSLAAQFRRQKSAVGRSHRMFQRQLRTRLTKTSKSGMIPPCT